MRRFIIISIVAIAFGAPTLVFAVPSLTLQNASPLVCGEKPQIQLTGGAPNTEIEWLWSNSRNTWGWQTLGNPIYKTDSSGNATVHFGSSVASDWPPSYAGYWIKARVAGVESSNAAFYGVNCGVIDTDKSTYACGDNINIRTIDNLIPSPPTSGTFRWSNGNTTNIWSGITFNVSGGFIVNGGPFPGGSGIVSTFSNFWPIRNNYWIEAIINRGGQYVAVTNQASFGVNCPIKPDLFISNGCSGSRGYTNLSWSSISGATSYSLYKCSGVGCTPTSLVNSGNFYTYSDTDLSNGSHSYRLRATNGSITSEYSDIKTAAISCGSTPTCPGQACTSSDVNSYRCSASGREQCQQQSGSLYCWTVNSCPGGQSCTGSGTCTQTAQCPGDSCTGSQLNSYRCSVDGREQCQQSGSLYCWNANGCPSEQSCAGSGTCTSQCTNAVFNSSTSGYFNVSGTEVPSLCKNVDFKVRCDFGVGTDNISAPTGCTWGRWVGTAAEFDCSGISSAQTISRNCSISAGGSGNICSAKTNTIGSLSITNCGGGGGETCTIGACSPGDQTQCFSSDKYRTCVWEDKDGDGTGAYCWQTPVSCPSGQTCSGGACIPSGGCSSVYYGYIDGYKFLDPGGDTTTNPPANQSVTITANDGTVGIDASNPFNPVQGVGSHLQYCKDHSVSVAVPSGFDVAYTVCYGYEEERGTCNSLTKPKTAGNSVVVNIPQPPNAAEIQNTINNLRTAHVSWFFTRTGGGGGNKPDLVISDKNITSPAPKPGDAISFTATVRNAGAGASPASQTRFRLNIDDNSTWDLQRNVSTGALAVGGTEQETLTNYWAATVGAHRYEFCADAAGAVDESNESNNCVSGTFEVEVDTPASPTDLSASGICDGTDPDIQLDWNSISDATDYHIERCTGMGCTNFTEINRSTTNSFLNATGITTGIRYRYRVRAHRHGDGVFSEYSNIKGATGPDCSIQTGNDPVGRLISASCSVIKGWACDPDNFNEPLVIKLYEDKGEGQVLFDTLIANRPRGQGVANQCGGNANHGFRWTAPEPVVDGTPTRIYAYAVDIGPGASGEISLNDSPIPPESEPGFQCLPSGGACDTSYPDDQFHACFFDGISAPTNDSDTLVQFDEGSVPSPVGAHSGPIDYDFENFEIPQTGKSDEVSAVWRGRINFKKGKYVFHVNSDDGVELTVRGGVVIGEWRDQTLINKTSSGTGLDLDGPTNVMLRWYEHAGEAQIKLWWDFTPAEPDGEGDPTVTLVEPVGDTRVTPYVVNRALDEDDLMPVTLVWDFDDPEGGSQEAFMVELVDLTDETCWDGVKPIYSDACLDAVNDFQNNDGLGINGEFVSSPAEQLDIHLAPGRLYAWRARAQSSKPDSEGDVRESDPGLTGSGYFRTTAGLATAGEIHIYRWDQNGNELAYQDFPTEAWININPVAKTSNPAIFENVPPAEDYAAFATDLHADTFAGFCSYDPEVEGDCELDAGNDLDFSLPITCDGASCRADDIETQVGRVSKVVLLYDTTTIPSSCIPGSTQCSDCVDNGDGDELADAEDPDCHFDRNADNPYSYDSDDNDESTSIDGTFNIHHDPKNLCHEGDAGCSRPHFFKDIQIGASPFSTETNIILTSVDGFAGDVEISVINLQADNEKDTSDCPENIERPCANGIGDGEDLALTKLQYRFGGVAKIGEILRVSAGGTISAEFKVGKRQINPGRYIITLEAKAFGIRKTTKILLVVGENTPGWEEQ
ncbi:MAG: hypothetical protein A3C83_00865 [Candidatus Ryanbacteria bacterium RIFCSPHIGHO2_02_FULL_47_25]|nr:MAG: hypothetical protein A3C83_00865 [Candidatus Ryanbacteria bacterium RIFCSPHIGHO2_02_FULL_47_25]